MIIEYRGYQIKPHKEVPTVFIVVTAGKGGKIPDVLSSMFTRTDYAKQAIDTYLAIKEQRGGQADSKS